MLVDYQMERQSPDKKLFVSAATVIPLWKRYIFVSGVTPGFTVTLPNVSEAEGRKFTFAAATIGAGGDVNIDYSDGVGANNSTSIGTTGVEVEFESIGTEWVITR